MEPMLGELQSFASANLFLLKVGKSEDDLWKFAGIASDEQVDTDGDKLMKDMFDLSYANQRGFVNWNHSRAPEDQIGYLTKAVIIDSEKVAALEEKFATKLSKTATVYVEGELYKFVEKARQVRDIMKSIPEGMAYCAGVGLSVDGVLAKSADGKVKAVVRGVAMTPTPAQAKTLCSLMKSLREASIISTPRLGLDEAVLFVLKQRPHWSYELAAKVVQYTVDNVRKES